MSYSYMNNNNINIKYKNIDIMNKYKNNDIY